MDTCSANMHTGSLGIDMATLENDCLAITILVGKGADIYELRDKKTGIDVLMKTDWGLRDPRQPPPAVSDYSRWVARYPGGWQELLPNGGPGCLYRGVEHTMHGEASVVPWHCEIVESHGDAAELVVSTRLLLSPLVVRRRMRVESGQPSLIVREELTNVGGVAVEYMWGHHPALGAPFLDDSCRIDVGAATLLASEEYQSELSPIAPGQRYRWPFVDTTRGRVDLSEVPARATQRDLLGYLCEWDGAW